MPGRALRGASGGGAGDDEDAILIKTSGYGRSRTPSIQLRTAVFAPIPSIESAKWRCRESRVPSQQAKPEPDVLQQPIDPHRNPDGARVFHGEGDIAKPSQRRIARIGRGHPPSDVVVGLALDMIADLLVRRRRADGGSCRPQDPRDRARKRLPFRRFDRELFPAFRGQSVVPFCTAIIFRGAVLKRDPPRSISRCNAG